MCLYLNIDLIWTEKGDYSKKKTDWLTDWHFTSKIPKFRFLHPSKSSIQINIHHINLLFFLYKLHTFECSAESKSIHVVSKKREGFTDVCLLGWILVGIFFHTHTPPAQFEFWANVCGGHTTFARLFFFFFFCAVLVASEINWYYTTN